jgi:hypothetical protein
LHCDLKPANILLDEDHKPRLADFGQSRLSHEQSPALGTLFYMAPEQADLNALPDARWDVYALGAILYRMLTGEPPYRSEEAVQRIEGAADLAERLERYQREIRSAPSPVAHRRVAGVDRRLAEIVDRCLAVNPNQRFPNVQAVLDALDARAEARLRRPLLLLGFVGPLLLLFIMSLFGLRGYEYAVRDSEDFISLRAWESNDFAAKFAARSIAGEIEEYFRLARQEAESPELHDKLRVVAESGLVRQLNTPGLPVTEVRQLRDVFLEDPQRVELNAFLERRLGEHLARWKSDPTVPKFASIFTLDAHGRMLASAYDDPVTDTNSVGWNFAFRTYFHGQLADIAGYTQERPPENVPPLRRTRLSAAFRSTATGKWKVAISTPLFVRDDPQGRVLGIVALTFNLGDFAYFRGSSAADRFAVLIDGRPGPNKGVILQHPYFDTMRKTGVALQDTQATAKYRLTDEQLGLIRGNKRYRYQDPFRQATGGDAFCGEWIAALARVKLPDPAASEEEMIVLVQERHDGAISPVKQLAQRLKREALWALLGILGVVLVLGYIVMKTMQEPGTRLRRIVPEGPTPTPKHGLTTLPGTRPPT